jgi:hypothetical protein
VSLLGEFPWKRAAARLVILVADKYTQIFLNLQYIFPLVGAVYMGPRPLLRDDDVCRSDI